MSEVGEGLGGQARGRAEVEAAAVVGSWLQASARGIWVRIEGAYERRQYIGIDVLR
jgi:hypothetical protein